MPHRVQVDGVVWCIEIIHDPARDVWLAAVGRGWEPHRWSRLPLAYDSAREAYDAAIGGIARLGQGHGKERTAA